MSTIRRSSSGTSAVPITTAPGTELLVRAVRPSDADELEAGFESLSADSRYRRFFTPKSALDDAMLERFVTPDQFDHVAIGALLADDVEPATGIGVARAFRSEDEPTKAEFAVAVLDAHHGNGIGSTLLDLLGGACLDVGIDTLTAEILTNNDAMLAMVRRRRGELVPIAGDASVMSAEIPTVALAGRVERSIRDRLLEHLAAERDTG